MDENKPTMYDPKDAVYAGPPMNDPGAMYLLKVLNGNGDKLDRILDRLMVGPKTTRVLAVPDGLLKGVIEMIRAGAGAYYPQKGRERTEYDLLMKWCDEQEAYLNRTKGG